MTASVVRGCAVVFLCLGLPSMGRADDMPTGRAALERLKAGNARFAADRPSTRNVTKVRRAETAKGQKPFAIILTCADSRVSPELIFDQGLGDLFVLRVAGNISEPAVLGSIEYALEHLHSPLIVVLGHDSCGAVKAAVDGGQIEGNLGWLVQRIEIGKDLPKDAKAALPTAIKNNTLRQAQLLSEQSKIIKEFVHSKRAQIAAGVYALDSGKIDWLELPDAKRPTPQKKE